MKPHVLSLTITLLSPHLPSLILCRGAGLLYKFLKISPCESEIRRCSLKIKISFSYYLINFKTVKNLFFSSESEVTDYFMQFIPLRSLQKCIGLNKNKLNMIGVVDSFAWVKINLNNLPQQVEWHPLKVNSRLKSTP